MAIYHRDAYRFKLLGYLLYCCVIPKRSLRYLGNETKSVQNGVRRAKREGLIKEERIHRRAYLTLGKPLNCYEALEGYVFIDYETHDQKLKKNYYRNEVSSEAKQKMQRLNQLAESSIFVGEAGINALPGEKESLRAEKLHWNDPVFYQSLEVKQYMESEEARAMASRVTGCICWKNEISMVYSLSDDLIKIGDITEKLNMERYYGYFCSKVNGLHMEDAYIFTWKYERVHERLELSRNFGSSFTLDGTYKNYYLIPYTREGNRLLGLLFRLNAKTELMDMIIRSSWRVDRDSIHIEADGVDENGVYVFNYLLPNVYRLKKFLKAAKMLPDKRFHIFCYDFQEEAVAKEAVENVTYSVYSLESVEVMYEKRMRRRNNESN